MQSLGNGSICYIIPVTKRIKELSFFFSPQKCLSADFPSGLITGNPQTMSPDIVAGGSRWSLPCSDRWAERWDRTQLNEHIFSMLCDPVSFPGRFVCLITSARSCSCNLKAARLAPAATAKKREQEYDLANGREQNWKIMQRDFWHCWSPGIFRSTMTNLP